MSRDEPARPDRILGGRLILHQRPGGHRAGTDAVLLAAAAPWPAEGLVVDLGCGSGAVGLAVTLRSPTARAWLVDLDPDALALAACNARANGVADRVGTIAADVTAPAPARHAAGLAPGQASLVLMNPPFAEAGEGRASPDPARRRAHVAPANSLPRWLAAAADLAGAGGEVVLIHRADALPRVLDAFEGRFGDVAARPVQPRAEAPAHRVLVRGVKGSRAPFRLLPALVLHESGGEFTPAAEAVHRGVAGIAW